MTTLGVALAGAVGAVTRALVDAMAVRHTRRGWPWGTFAINVSGSFTAGILVGLALDHGLTADSKAVLSAGFLGAYTTFSTHAFEVVALAEQRRGLLGTLYALASALAGLVAAASGLALVTAI